MGGPQSAIIVEYDPAYNRTRLFWDGREVTAEYPPAEVGRLHETMKAVWQEARRITQKKDGANDGQA
jgi:hypothetical protein